MNFSVDLMNEIEKDRIIRELRTQNELMLEQHKKALEQEFQKQMRDFVTTMQGQGQGQGQGQTADAHVRTGMQRARVTDGAALDRTTKQFYRAARHAESAPQLLLFEDESRVAVVRASLENGRASASAVSRSSGGKIGAEQQEHRPKLHRGLEGDVGGGVDAGRMGHRHSSVTHAGAPRPKTVMAPGPTAKTLPRVSTASPLLTNHAVKLHKSANHSRASTAIGAGSMTTHSEFALDNTVTEEDYAHALRRNKLSGKHPESESRKAATDATAASRTVPLSRMDQGTQAMLRKSSSLVHETQTLDSRRSRRRRRRREGEGEDEDDHEEEGGYEGDELGKLPTVTGTGTGTHAPDELSELSDFSSANAHVPRNVFTASASPGHLVRKVGFAMDFFEDSGPIARTAPEGVTRRKLPTVSLSVSADDGKDKPQSSASPSPVPLELPRCDGGNGRPKTSLWSGRTVTPAADTEANAPVRRKSQWENEIARHIISMYASTQAGDQEAGGGPDDGSSRPNPKVEMLLRFAAPDATAPSAVVSEVMRSSALPPPSRAALLREGGLVPGATTTGKSSPITGRNVGTTPDRSKKSGTKGKKSAQLPAVPASTTNQKSPDVDAEKKAKIVGKLRSSVQVRSRSGGAGVEVRAPPRCYPIWFVSTGDVYADWTVMPEGGAGLQAQLAALFEQGEYMQYLVVAEAALSRAIARLKLTEASIQGKDPRFLKTRYPNPMPPAKPRKHSRTADQPPSSLSSSLFSDSFISQSSHTQGPDPRPPPALCDESIDSMASLVGRRPPSAGVSRAHGEGDGGVDGGMGNGNGNGNGGFGSISEVDLDLDSFCDLSLEDANSALVAVIPFWKQLVATANAFGTLCVEKKQFNKALLLVRFAEVQCGRDDLLPKAVRMELKAHVYSAMAFFFFSRKKTRAAMSRLKAAVDIFRRLGEAHVMDEALVLLRLAACESQSSDFKAAHKLLYQVLALAESGDLLAKEATNPKQLCIVAVAYHNLAVAQLKLQDSEAACKSSQNARKLARLCLSYSNRWLPTLQWTHQVALEDVQHRLKMGGALEDYQVDVMGRLTDMMFDPKDG